jgi:hypothetical protein
VTNTPDITTPCLDAGPVEDDGIVPINPFFALRYQFGMLLGVEDFEAAQAYARGKMRLHNAWLHREGVVWGFGVTAPPVSTSDQALRGEIQVDPGLALDSLGHELHLDAPACISVAAWYEKHKADPGVPLLDPATGGTITARIELRFRACLARQVPAMTDPCDGGGTGTAYSRAFETVEIKLVPGAAPARAYPYHLVRLLFGLDDPQSTPTADELAVQNALADVAALAPDQRAKAFLAALRRFAAIDGIALRPGLSADQSRTLLVPGDEDAPIVIAQLSLAMKPDAKGGSFHLDQATIDPTVRPSHIATSTIQELNLFAAAGAALGMGPRFARATFAVSPSRINVVIQVAADSALLPLDPASFDVYYLAPSGASSSVETPSTSRARGVQSWQKATISAVSAGEDNVVSVTASPLPPGASRIRFIAHGTGTSPLLGQNGWPLDGSTDEPRRGTAHDGRDFVHMWIIQEDS